MNSDRHSNYTGRYPRSLSDAFGPYTDNRIFEEVPKMHPSDKIVSIASVIAMIALISIIYIWG